MTMSPSVQSHNFLNFNYNDHQIRTITHEDGSLWWVAKDVCAILGLGNVTKAILELDLDDKKDITYGNIDNNLSKLRAINESGLYNLIFKSRKPEAKKFKRWITHEVLPSIRKTGSYHYNSPLAIPHHGPYIPPELGNALNDFLPITKIIMDGKEFHTVNAHTLHFFLGSSYCCETWVKNKANRHKYKENKDYIVTQIKYPFSNRVINIFNMTTSMALDVCLLEWAKSDMGEQIRGYLKEYEQWISDSKILIAQGQAALVKAMDSTAQTITLDRGLTTQYPLNKSDHRPSVKEKMNAVYVTAKRQGRVCH